MAKQTFTTGQVLTAAQMNSLQSNDFNQTVDVKTAAYTLVATDKGKRIEFNTSGSVTCTVNTGLFDAGDTLIIQNRGAGTVTITAGTATVNTSASLALTQYSAGTLYFVSASAALFFGDAAGISASIVDAKGDLIVGTADNTVSRLAVGANGTTLVADSAETTGLKWQAPSGGTLAFITRSTFSAAATVTIDNIFSSTYETYLLVFERILQSSGANMRAQFRYGSTTQNAGYYSNVVCFAATQTQQLDNNTTYGTLMHNMNASQQSAAAMWVNGVGQTSERAYYHGTGVAGGLGPGCPYIFANWQINAQTYTGIEFTSSAGNLTGEISVYGVKAS